MPDKEPPAHASAGDESSATSRSRARLEVLDDTIRVLSERDILFDSVGGLRDRRALVSVLQGLPWQLSPASAEHVADLRLAQFTEMERERLVSEASTIREALGSLE